MKWSFEKISGTSTKWGVLLLLSTPVFATKSVVTNTVQFVSTIWMASLPLDAIEGLVAAHQTVETQGRLRSGHYGQSHSFTSTDSGSPVSSKNTYSLSTPNILMLQPMTVTDVREVPQRSLCCAGEGLREVSVEVPNYFMANLNISFVSVLKPASDVCLAGKRSGKNGKRTTPESYMRNLRDYHTVSHVLNYDEKKIIKFGKNREVKGYSPRMKQVTLKNGDMYKPKDYGTTYSIENPLNAVHLYQVFQHVCPLGLERTQVITRVFDDQGKQIEEVPPRKVSDEMIEHAKSLIAQSDERFQNFVASGGAPSCSVTNPGGIPPEDSCYQDDLLGTDCSTTIFKVKVIKNGAEDTVDGILIVPADTADAMLFFIAPDEDVEENTSQEALSKEADYHKSMTLPFPPQDEDDSRQFLREAGADSRSFREAHVIGNRLYPESPAHIRKVDLSKPNPTGSGFKYHDDREPPPTGGGAGMGMGMMMFSN